VGKKHETNTTRIRKKTQTRTKSTDIGKENIQIQKKCVYEKDERKHEKQ
jgi:hypothetical protein